MLYEIRIYCLVICLLLRFGLGFGIYIYILYLYTVYNILALNTTRNTTQGYVLSMYNLIEFNKVIRITTYVVITKIVYDV